MDEALAALPIIVVEENRRRIACSIDEVRRTKALWTVYSVFLLSAEYLIREAGSTASLSSVIDALGLNNMRLPSQPLVSELSIRDWTFDRAFYAKEVDRIVINRDLRRLDLRWVERSSDGRWLNYSRSLALGLRDELVRDLQRGLERDFQWSREPYDRYVRDFNPSIVFVGVGNDIEVSGRIKETIVRAHQRYFVLPGTELSASLSAGFADAERAVDPAAGARLWSMLLVVTVVGSAQRGGRGDRAIQRSEVRGFLGDQVFSLVSEYFPLEAV
jgi:hypothetical protein